MVSLNPGLNSSTHGAIFFSDEAGDDETILTAPVLMSDQGKEFSKIKTIPLFGSQIIVSTLISITSIVFACHWSQETNCEGYYIVQYLHVAFWLFSFVIDHIAHYHHNNIRLKGYHQFYKETSILHRLSLYVVSLWNAVLLAMQTLMQHFYEDDFTKHCGASILSPVGYVTLFVIVETAVLIGVNGVYIYKAFDFNMKHLPPDVLKSEWIRQMATMSEGQRSDAVGFTQQGRNIAELLEKQADIISYLQEHNTKLSRKLMLMNAQLRESRSNIT
ncbi:transmembrane protein 192 [Ctenocephalides felis]|uniref:transmembrane protein 192 n=1 Tax=Ctenocephalides felis TaxID=7515 RepID=UPI000E6E3BF8|nr:transmembrane protein 192 [Ctenocephalides felis]